MLREYMAQKVANYKPRVQDTEGHIAACLASLNRIAPDDDDRHAITSYLFGVQSSKDLTEAQRSVLLDWIGANKENEYQPNQASVTEAQRVIRTFRESAGQQTLPLAELPIE